MDAKIFRVNYKSDFILTLTSDAGWLTPFCIKFWTGSPMLAYYASYDGETYTHCTYDPSDPTKLTVQFDDHHLPIGDLKYQVAYHFTVADFPENTEDEVTNQANVTTVINGETYQVMLDLNGETAPEIQFALPAYANELQRIQNEQTRIAQEQQRVSQEQTRINQEAARVTEFNGIVNTANNDHQRANEDHSRALTDHQNALDDRSQAASDHSRAQSDHNTATSDHLQANSDHSRAQSDHNTAISDHQTALSDHTQANYDHTRAESDHSRATSDSSTAANDHRIAAADHTQANTDHNRAENDHQRVETDLAAVEEFSNSLGPYDISAAHATGSTLATYPDLATALGQNGSNIPESLRKGGMSVKFVLTYDNNSTKYVQYRLMKDTFSTTPADWQGVDDEPSAGSNNLVKSGGVYNRLKTYSEIQKQTIQTSDDEITVFDNSNNELLHITASESDIKNLKSNGKSVLTEDNLEDLATKEELDTKQDVIQELEYEGVYDWGDEIAFETNEGDIVATVKPDGTIECNEIKTNHIETESIIGGNPGEEQIFSNDAETDTYAAIGSYGIKAKDFLHLDGTPLIPEKEEEILCLTDTIYTFVGSELCIYADAIVKSIDGGLMSPLNYKVLWNCDIGIVSDRFYKLEPISSNIGSHSLRTRVYNMEGELVIDKTSTIVVLGVTSFSSAKNILFVGDSLGRDTATQIFNRFDGLGGVSPNFVGSLGDTAGKKYEARGGWRFYDYSHEGRPQYRAIVSNVGSLSRNAVYEDASNNSYTIVETNIDSLGSGNIALSYSNGAPIPSGTLSKVSGSGDDTITIDSATFEGYNPFWNFTTNELDIANYRSAINLSAKIDIVVFQLLVNDANYGMPLNSIENSIQELYSAFITDNPNTIVLISLGTTNGNTISGTRTNGGASKDTIAYHNSMWSYRKMLLENYANNEDYPNIRVSSVCAQLDRYYGYQLTDYRTSKYVVETFRAHTNYVHPDTIGYQQLAEAWVGEFLSLN